MKQLLSFLLNATLSFSFTFSPAPKVKHHNVTVVAEDSVYICNSNTAYACHKS